jgi:ABC-2 type transport system ATP-binding protein
MSVIESFGLSVRYGESWALRDCTIAVPEGHVVALVGSNGAGKTTLLHCTMGLATPTSGRIAVMGFSPGSADILGRAAFVAQDAPLYQQLSVREMLEVADSMNERFDKVVARSRLQALDIPLKRKVGKLSGGQQAQVALTLALARHPALLVLDEPLSRLDPVARHDVMALVLSITAEEGLSVIFSSHVVSELERVADYLILMTNGQIQMTGEIDDFLARHAILSGPLEGAQRIAESFAVVQTQQAARRLQLIVRADRSSMSDLPDGWEVDDVSLDELVIAYLRDPTISALAGPLAITGQQLEGGFR